MAHTAHQLINEPRARISADLQVQPRGLADSYGAVATTYNNNARRAGVSPDEKRCHREKDSDRTTDFWITIAGQAVIAKIGEQVRGYTVTGSLSEI